MLGTLAVRAGDEHDGDGDELRWQPPVCALVLLCGDGAPVEMAAVEEGPWAAGRGTAEARERPRANGASCWKVQGEGRQVVGSEARGAAVLRA